MYVSSILHVIVPVSVASTTVLISFWSIIQLAFIA